MLISRLSHHAALIGLVLGSVVLAGCGETTVSAPLSPSGVEVVATPSLTGAAGSTLPDAIVVRVLGTDGQPLPGATVGFTTDGGSAKPATAVTDANGIASTRWTLRTSVGQSVLNATASNGVSIQVTAVVTAADAADVSAVAGNGQSAPAGSSVPVAPSVRVLDRFGNLAADVQVSFTVQSGNGQVTGALPRTDATGVATVGSWVLGPGAGPQTLVARVEANGVAHNPIVFTVNATTPAGATMVVAAGDQQQASVGRLVPTAPSVVIRTAGGVGIPGAEVTFAVAAGGGALVGAHQVTDASGTATVGGWFLGPLPGVNRLTASSPGVTSLTFTATGVASIPVSMTAVSQTTQAAPAGTNVQDPPSVVVRDAQGIPVPGVQVAFAVTSGGGTIVGSPVTTSANGVATVTSWTLGPALGPNTVTATSTGLPVVSFTATGTAGAAAKVLAFSGTNQAAVKGDLVQDPPTVRVLDANGNPVVGAAVTFSVTGGGGSATGTNQVTNVQGQAAVGSWRLGAGAPNEMTATVSGTGISGNPVLFIARAATQILLTGAPATPVTLGDNFTISVQLRDASGNPVALAGVQLDISIATGGGVLGGTQSRLTDSSGTVDFVALNVTGAAGVRTFKIDGTNLVSAISPGITFN